MEAQNLDIVGKLMKKTPQICGKVFEFLDDKSLCQSKLVCKSWLNFIENEKFYWRRVTRDLKEKEWSIVTAKMSSDNVQLLGRHYISPEFCKEYQKRDFYAHPLYCAISLDNFEITQEVLQHFPEMLTEEISPSQDHSLYRERSIIRNSSHPLIFAACRGKIQIFHVVKKNGGDINPTIKNGWTPMYGAAENGHLNVFQFLMENIKGNLNPQEDSGDTCLHKAAENGHLEICELIIKNVSIEQLMMKGKRFGQIPIFRAARNGHFEVFKILFEKLDLNNYPIDESESTLLHEAAYGGSLEMCQLILDNFFESADMLDECLRPPLHWAAQKGHLEICKLLIERSLLIPGCGRSFFNHNENGRDTPLHVAAMEGHLEVCKLIVENMDGEKNPSDYKQGNTPLHSAALRGHVDVCRLFVQQISGDKNPKDLDGYTPLHRAALKGRFKVCQFLVNENHADINLKTDYGDTPLELAKEFRDYSQSIDWPDWGIRFDHSDLEEKYRLAEIECCYRFLLRCKHFGVKVNGSQDQNTFDIMGELMKKAPQVCGKVLEYLDNKSLCRSKVVCKSWFNFIDNEKIYWRRVVGNSKEWNIVIVKMASENVKSLGNHYINPGFRRKNFDKTCHPIYCAISLDNLEIIQEVLDAFPTLLNPPILDSHPLNYAARKGKFQIFQAVKNSGGILHPRCDDAGGWTPLHFAAEKNQIEFFKIYIEKISGEVLIEDDNEETPLDLALDCDHLELVKFLIEHSGGNFKVVRRNRDSRGLIQNAALKGLFDIFKIAFEKLIGDKNPRLRGNVTLLHLAASGGNIEICQFLINNIQGIVDMSKTNGETPLHEASSKGQIEVCKLLVDKMGIDKNPKDNQGRTPLHLAALKGHLEVCKFLLEHVEGEKNPPDFQGNTPFHLAASKGRMDTSLLFLRDLQQDPDQENFEQKTPVILARDYFALARQNDLLYQLDKILDKKDRFIEIGAVYVSLLMHSRFYEEIKEEMENIDTEDEESDEDDYVYFEFEDDSDQNSDDTDQRLEDLWEDEEVWNG